MSAARFIFPKLFMLLCLAISLPLQAEQTLTLEIDEEIEIDILQIGESSSKTAIIWFACNQGDETVEFITARKMTASGYQFYFPDMLSAHFLSPTPSNIARVPSHEVERVIKHILANTKAEQLYLVAGGRAAVPVLKGLAQKDIKSEQSKIKGALLITPRINKLKPEPGSEPVYIDVAGLSTHPVRVLEGERTPNRWGLPHLKATLARSGSTVSTDLIKGVRGFFYLRTEKTPEEEAKTAELDQLIHLNIQNLGAIKP